MENKEILKEINKKIEICKETINARSAEETKAFILDIEKLIEKFKPENDIQKNIIKNRFLDVKNLKISSQNHEKEKGEKQNTFYGKVDRIDFADCEKWMKENEENWQSKVDNIKAFVQEFPFTDNLINGLGINEYVIGTGKNTFCWYLENGTPGKMGQRSSFDYYIYWSGYDNAFATMEKRDIKLIQLNEAEKVFNALKTNLEKMLKLVNTGKIDVIDEQRQGLELPKANILQKILFLYFPEKFIGYYSSGYVSKISAMLGINTHADVYQTNHTIAKKVAEKITNPKLSAIDKNVGFTIYLYDEWNDYIKKSVG